MAFAPLGRAHLVDKTKDHWREGFAAEIVKVGDEGSRVRRFVASTEDVDRDSDIIRAKGWDLKNFKKNSVILWAHDHKALAIGKGKATKDATTKQLMIDIDFAPADVNPFADSVLRFIDWADSGAVSVGFISKDSNTRLDDDGNETRGREFTKQELLEVSVVNVPSNPNAIQAAVDEDAITSKEAEVLTKSLIGGGFLEDADDAEDDMPSKDLKITYSVQPLEDAVTQKDFKTFEDRVMGSIGNAFQKLNERFDKFEGAHTLLDDSFRELAAEIREVEVNAPATSSDDATDKADLAALKNALAEAERLSTALGLND